MIVVWRVTERCNLSCPFCAYDRKLSWPRREADAEVVRRFGWIGGEPFLFPQLADLTVLFTSELGLRVSATTNGTMLSSAAVREHIIAHYAELTISVDGLGPVHDQLRGWSNGYLTLRKSVGQLAEAIRRRQQGPRLRANVVLMRHTISDFEHLCLELASWGFAEITFNQLGGRDRPEFFPAHRLLPDDAAWLTNEIPRLRSRLAALGVRLSGSDNYLSRIQASSRDESIAMVSCRAGERFQRVHSTVVIGKLHSVDSGFQPRHFQLRLRCPTLSGS